MVSIFQNVSIIFFSAAKETNESKIQEEDENEHEINEATDSETDSAISDNDHDELDEDNNENEKDALTSTEQDIELFKKQLGDLDKAVCNTADKIDRIQEVLDKVVESLRLGKPIEDYPAPESTDNKQIEESENQKQSSQEKESESDDQAEGSIENEANVQNSYEIFDREKLLEVLRKTHVDRQKNPPRLTVGMIGYPNVGKSSTVNVLMQVKKVRKSKF